MIKNYNELRAEAIERAKHHIGASGKDLPKVSATVDMHDHILEILTEKVIAIERVLGLFGRRALHLQTNELVIPLPTWRERKVDGIAQIEWYDGDVLIAIEEVK